MTEQIETFYPSEIVDIDSVKPWPTNYKIHPDRQIAALGKSIGTFGQTKNVVCWRGYIVAGHGLWTSAKHRGWSRVEIKRLPEEWNEQQVEACLIADNRTAEMAGTNDEQLTAMLLRIRQHENGKRLEELTGYDEDEVNSRLASMRQYALINGLNEQSGMGPAIGKTTIADAYTGNPDSVIVSSTDGSANGEAELDDEYSHAPVVALGEAYTMPTEAAIKPTYVQLQFPMFQEERDKVVSVLNYVKDSEGLATSIQALVHMAEEYAKLKGIANGA